jgi:hypothetical protein
MKGRGVRDSMVLGAWFPKLNQLNDLMHFDFVIGIAQQNEHTIRTTSRVSLFPRAIAQRGRVRTLNEQIRCLKIKIKAILEFCR